MKVHVPIEDGRFEGLWAFSVGPGRFKLDNNPFYAYGISAGDVVEAELSDGVLKFKSVAHKSGNRTLRIMFDRQLRDAHPRKVLAMLVSMGCDFEGAKTHLASVCVPPSVSIESVEAFLDSQRHLEWENGDR